MTRYELEHLLNIGEFYLNSGILELCDPAVNDMLCLDLPIAAFNQVSVIVRNCPSGQFRACYELDSSGEPVSLICFPAAVSYEDILPKQHHFSFTGSVAPQFSHTICAVDAVVKNDASGCSRGLEPDAFYEPQDLLDVLNTCPYPPDVLCELESYLSRCVTASSYASGKKLLNIVKPASCAWYAFRSKDVSSSHWSCDVLSRVNAVSAACFTGGMIMRTGRGSHCDIYVLRGRAGMTTAVRILPQNRSY